MTARLVGMALLGALAASSVQAAALTVAGGTVADMPADASGVRGFKGLPYAAPPVGDLRWHAPLPVPAWTGERRADQFGPRCMQTDRLGAIDPLNQRMSEDCLYLNVWTPAKSADERLPVMVWIYGGSFNVGAGSEPWYDGTNLAKKGVVLVTLNYRVDVFGFLAHPELTAETGQHASGNWGLLDQLAAVRWVKQNIAAFGGDPGKITIFGESAGSISVSALMASPLGKGLFQRAIGESGSILWPDKSPFALPTLAKAEQAGQGFAGMLGANSIAELRAKPAAAVLDAVAKNPAATAIVRGPVIDGAVLPANATELFGKGQQNDVDLLAGSNADEGTLFAARAPTPTPDAYTEQVRKLFGDQTDAVLQIYPAVPPEQTKAEAAALLGDQIIAYPTFLWNELQARTGKAPTYRYFFNHRPPAPALSLTPLASDGVFHSAEITYVFNNLQVRDWPWQPADHQLADTVSSYWTNFAKTGNPNGPGLPQWPAYRAQPDGQVMRFGDAPVAGPDPHLARYDVLNRFYMGQ